MVDKSTKAIGQGVGIAIGIVVLLLLASTVLPVGLNELNGTSTSTFNQSEGETVQVTGPLNGTLDNVSDTDSTIDVTVNDTELSETRSITNLGEGQNETVTIDGEDITVTNNEVISATNAEVEYQYPKSYGWSGGAQSIFGIFDLLLVLIILLMGAGWAVKASP